MTNISEIKKFHFLTPKTLGEQLGASRTTVWRWTRSDVNPLPYIKVGGKILFDFSSVLEWLQVTNQERIKNEK